MSRFEVSKNSFVFSVSLCLCGRFLLSFPPRTLFLCVEKVLPFGFTPKKQEWPLPLFYGSPFSCTMR